MAVNTIKGAIVRDKHFTFRCNVCGDSKNKNKKRGHLRYSKNPRSFERYWTYKCFNEGDCPCAGTGNAMSGDNWLKEYFPSLYKNYIIEILENKKDLKEIELENKKKIDEYKRKEELENKKKIEKEKEDTKYFIPITSKKDIANKAIKLCEKRKIPRDVYNNFFIAIDGKYKDRMIIPFYDDKGKIYYFQSRLIIDNDLYSKYLNRTLNKDEAIYNIHNINKNEPVCVFEGPIDSLFVENSIATLGLGISIQMQCVMDEFDCYYIFDDDEAGKNTSLKFLLKGNKVFNWVLFKKDNNIPNRNKWDFNDIYIFLNRTHKFCFNELECYFTNNFFDSFYFE
jgi:hypothetical protein